MRAPVVSQQCQRVIGVSASLRGTHAISAAVTCVSLTKSEAECLSSLQEPFAFSFHEKGRVLRLLFLPFAFSFYPLLHCDPVIDLLEFFTYDRNKLFVGHNLQIFSPSCFVWLLLCRNFISSIFFFLFRVFEMIKTVLCVYLGVFVFCILLREFSSQVYKEISTIYC